jgi:Cu2+-exporting ATPase
LITSGLNEEEKPMNDSESKDPNTDQNHQDHGNHEKHGDHEDHGGHEDHHAHMAADFKRRFVISLIVSIPVVLLAPLIQNALGVAEAWAFPGDRFVQFAFSAFIFIYGGKPFITGMVDELKKKTPGMMTLIGLAIVVAFVYSSLVTFGLPGKVFFWELSTLIVIMLLGHWIEMRSVMSASGALEELVKLLPATAHRQISDNETEEVSVTELSPEDRIVVKPGEKVPTDGRIVEGKTSINESLITGESTPVEKGEGAEVVGGSVNGAAAIVVEVEKTGDDTYLSRVIDMVKKARESKSRAQSTADRAAFWLTIAALAAGGITLVVWIASGREFVFSLERMVTVMVITCPHALGLAVPLVVAITTTLAAKRGLLIRNRTAFERARNLSAVVFDKTGTLTEGRFGVTDIYPRGDREENEILRLAAALESRSEHPIAQGIVKAAEDRRIALSTPEDFTAIAGKGAQATLDGDTVKVVSPGYLAEQNISVDDDFDPASDAEGKTLVYVLVNDKPVGAIALADVIREESREAVSALKKAGIQVMMLTGDARAVADWVARELSLDQVFAEVLPDQKSAKIQSVRKEGHTVAMVGDGVNDAPALAESDLGVAIGAGTDVAVESADVVLVRSDPRDVTGILDLSRAARRKTIQNLWWAAGYNIVAIPLAAGVLYPFTGFLLPPAAGAVVMSLSTVIVAVNAKLLK